jgi:hypothetical protein
LVGEWIMGACPLMTKFPAWKVPEMGMQPAGNELWPWGRRWRYCFVAAVFTLVDTDASIRPDVD